MSNNPYETPIGFDASSGGGDASQFARDKVNGPGIGLIVVGIIGILFSVLGLISGVLAVAGIYPTAEAQAEQSAVLREQLADSNLDPGMIDMLVSMQESSTSGFGLISAGLTLVVGVFILLGGVKMRQLNSYGLALVGAILSVIPCLNNCCAWLVGLPIGIWAIVVLMDQNVKNGFR